MLLLNVLRFLKPTIWHFFYLMFYALYLTIVNLNTVFKINLPGSCLPAFSYSAPLWTILSWKELLKEQLKLRNLTEVSGIFGLFGILKICGFVFVNINLIFQLNSWRSIATYFTKLTLTRCCNCAFCKRSVSQIFCKGLLIC